MEHKDPLVSIVGKPELLNTVGLLHALGFITEEAYAELAKDLSAMIQSSNARTAIEDLKKAISEVEKRLGGQLKIEPWVFRLETLEQRVEALEKSLTKKKV